MTDKRPPSESEVGANLIAPHPRGVGGQGGRGGKPRGQGGQGVGSRQRGVVSGESSAGSRQRGVVSGESSAGSASAGAGVHRRGQKCEQMQSLDRGRGQGAGQKREEMRAFAYLQRAGGTQRAFRTPESPADFAKPHWRKAEGRGIIGCVRRRGTRRRLQPRTPDHRLSANEWRLAQSGAEGVRVASCVPPPCE